LTTENPWLFGNFGILLRGKNHTNHPYTQIGAQARKGNSVILVHWKGTFASTTEKNSHEATRKSIPVVVRCSIELNDILPAPGILGPKSRFQAREKRERISYHIFAHPKRQSCCESFRVDVPGKYSALLVVPASEAKES